MSQGDEESYNIYDLVCGARDAVVEISSQVITYTGDKYTVKIFRGNGFFIKGHYIICPASLLLVAIDDSIERATKILVGISNVNGCDKSYSYEADIIGIDGASNIGILKINMDRSWNKNNPAIKPSHPFLLWGKSRNVSPGASVIVIGNIVSDDMNIMASENAVACGNIADNRYVDPTGVVSGELILLNNIVASGSQIGLPVISMDGNVIGMLLKSHYALSEFFLRRPIKGIITTYQNTSQHYSAFVEAIIDAAGDYYRFNKSWLGLNGIIMCQDDFNTNLSLELNSFTRIPILEPNEIKKDIVGYRITFVDPNSPVINIINVGDIVTHINDCPLGDRKGQISPSLILWRIAPYNNIIINYKKQSERFLSSHQITTVTKPYPFDLDTPSRSNLM